MDDIMYEKLLANQFQRIFFTLDSLSEAAQTNAAPGVFSFIAEGRLAVAGVTNQVTMPVAISREQGSLLKFSGGISVRMTDFKITPPEPTAAGGIIKTGNEVQLSFVWWTRPPKPSSN
jgi:polyisoprenoid-binding protein YceI